MNPGSASSSVGSLQYGSSTKGGSSKVSSTGAGPAQTEKENRAFVLPLELSETTRVKALSPGAFGQVTLVRAKAGGQLLVLKQPKAENKPRDIQDGRGCQHSSYWID